VKSVGNRALGVFLRSVSFETQPFRAVES